MQNKEDDHMSGEEMKSMQKEYVLQSWSKQKGLNPIPVEKAEGIYLWDYDGNRYSDMSAQLVNMNLGFGNKAIGDAIKEQVDKYCYVAPSYAADPRAKLAKKIIELMPDNMGKLFFTNAGAEANENAVKMARMYTGRFKVFSRYRSYHGSSFGAGNLTGEPRRYPLEPGIPGFIKFFDPYLYREVVPFESEEAATNYYIAKLREQIIYEGPGSVAAIVIETVTGSNGLLIPPKGYLPGMRALCDEFGILMICDEVMAGWGRTGKMFAFENFDVKPDMVTFAKGVTCGYVPLGGVVVSKKVAEYFDDNYLSCGLTYSGHPLACAAGVACVNYYEEANILENVNKVGKVLGEKLEALKAAHPCVGDVRYIGLFSAVELVKDKTTKEALVPYGKDPQGIMGKIIGKLKEKKFMTYSHENMILVAPPLIITEEQLKEELAKLDEVLSYVDGEFL
ncbi:MAG TPA: aminotransferase class III-fold pyridoxal phosphate-dependent enzyme [Mobilitalea sp.]|nr:aminotransferase class III-fold pyridoxal phosphate-dependent enzyme [Mobilitalea sp.]